MSAYPVIEHRTGRVSRWFRANRIRVAFLVAVVETILVVTNLVQWRWALLIAGAVFAFHFFIGRRARFAWLRQLSWTAAVSQTLPVVIPVAVGATIAVAVLAIVGGAVVVLALVFFGRR
ncbi:MAG: hypothetical protein M3265_00325 [Actinomycetota bacterium]|nr:hypothetical protein [Actinomycetota bacterium]